MQKVNDKYESKEQIEQRIVNGAVKRVKDFAKSQKACQLIIPLPINLGNSTKRKVDDIIISNNKSSYVADHIIAIIRTEPSVSRATIELSKTRKVGVL